MTKEFRKQMRDEIMKMLEMSDEDRIKYYGTTGWKLLISRYLEETKWPETE